MHTTLGSRTPLLAAALGLVALAAGTLVPAGAAAPTPTFGTPVAIPGATVSEPGVNIGTGGSIYVNGPAGLLSNLPGGASPIFKSTDGGTSWTTTPPSTWANLPGGGDSNLAVDPVTGTLYFTDLWLGSDTVSRSTDGAASWTTQPLGGPPIQDRQWVAAAGDGDVYQVVHQIPVGLIVSKSVAPLDGLVYPVSTVAATVVDQTGCVCPSGNIIAEAPATPAMLGTADKVGVIYATSTGGVNFAYSTNGGLTFTTATVSPNSAVDTSRNFPVVANAGGGKLVAVWLEVLGETSSNSNGTSDQVQLATSTDWGATWSRPKTIAGATSGTSVFPWVAAAGQKVAVSLYHASGTFTPDNAPSATPWFESYLESTDGGTTFSSLATVDPTPATTGIVCTAGATCSSGRQLGDFQSVALDSSGLANVAYDRVTNSGSQTTTMFARES